MWAFRSHHSPPASMRIPAFEVRDRRSLALAQWTSVPPLMVIAGPNGCGKSTLLHALHNQYGPKGILYVGPHRNMRRQGDVAQRNLLQQKVSVEEMMMLSNVPNMEGVRITDGNRDPWNADEAANFLKHGMCQLEMNYDTALIERFKLLGELKKSETEDIWEPLKTLTNTLLPHLEFAGIQKVDGYRMKVTWRVHKKDVFVDLDELSSGEKAIIQMGFPLVEHRIRAAIERLKGAADTSTWNEVTVLIDEPEIHLHPNLQMKLLDYLRGVAAEEGTQVIITTQSPTIVEHATFEELFLLRPVELVLPGENQLIPVATDEERLTFLRNTFGTTSNLTAMQPVVLAEGVSDEKATNVVGARQMFRALSPKFDSVTLVAGGGKSECLKLRGQLQEALQTFSPNLKVMAIIDQDTTVPSTKVEHVHVLPVSVVENFAIDPAVVWQTIQGVVQKTNFKSVDDVAAALDVILDAMEEDEIHRRLLQALDFDGFRAKLPVVDIPRQLDEHVAALRAKYDKSAIDKKLADAKTVVADIATAKRRRELYDGKKILARFYKEHMHATGMSKQIFQYQAAREARERKSVREFVETLFTEIEQAPADVKAA